MIKDYIRNLSNEELLNAFSEIEQFNKKGVCPEGVVRNLYNTITDNLGDNWSIDWLSKEIIYEIAKRWYRDNQSI